MRFEYWVQIEKGTLWFRCSSRTQRKRKFRRHFWTTKLSSKFFSWPIFPNHFIFPEWIIECFDDYWIANLFLRVISIFRCFLRNMSFVFSTCLARERVAFHFIRLWNSNLHSNTIVSCFVDINRINVLVNSKVKKIVKSRNFQFSIFFHIQPSILFILLRKKILIVRGNNVRP